MIWKKDPLFKKMFVFLISGVILINLIPFLGNWHLVNRIAAAGINISADIYSSLIFINIISILLLISLNTILFIGILKYISGNLEIVSLAIDRIMDGDFSIITGADDREGILSRLESQFAQMSRRMHLHMENLHREKENIKSLVSNISHQIKTPLASIKVFNSLLLEEDISPAEQYEFLHSIKNEVDKLEWLSASLLKISRLEAGMIQLHKEPGDIKQTILEVVNGVYLKALEKDIEISLNDLKSIIINHDLQWTKEALFNVLENAVKYTPAKGQVKVDMEKLETYIKIDIEDNGIGIEEQEIIHIFDRFYRGRAEIVKNSEGAGIGLYLSRKILEEQGGGLIVSSVKDQGTRFSILLTLPNCKEIGRDL